MTQKTHPLDTKQTPITSTVTPEQSRAKQKPDEKEATGKQKSDGQKEQKDHKGTR